MSMTLILGKKISQEGLNACMNYEFNLLHHVGVAAKTLRAGQGRAEKTKPSLNVDNYVCPYKLVIYQD